MERRRKSNGVCNCIFVLIYAAIASMAVICLMHIQEFDEHIDYSQLSDYKSNKLLSDQFDAFIKTNRRSYLTQQEKDMRFQIFAQNLLKIREHNQGGHAYELGINSFADLTDDEFSSRYLMPAYQVNSYFDEQILNEEAIQDDVNIDHSSLVGKAKDQGVCGSCWAFGAVGALEYVFAVNNGNKLVEFSEQQLVDCCTGSKYPETNGCDGGEKVDAFDYTTTVGIAKEIDYTYNGMDNPCKTNVPIVFKTTGSHPLPPGDNDALLERLKIQVIDIGINAAPFAFRFYKAGIVDFGCTYTEIDHDVTLTGAGTDPATGLPYWRIKNSWGPNWGDHGFIRILREQGIKPAQCAMNMDSDCPLYGSIS